MTQPFFLACVLPKTGGVDWIWPVGGSWLLDALLIPGRRDEHVTHKGSKTCYEIEFMDTGR